MAVTADRRKVLAFRLRRQHLMRRLGAASTAEVTATCSVRNSKPGSAQAALLARVNGVSEERVAAALSERCLIEVYGPRMVPTLVRPQDMAVFTVGGIGTDDESLGATLGKVAASRLAEADIRPTDALTRVVEAAHAELADGARGKGELSAAMTARLPESMLSWCERYGSRHIYEELFRLPGLVGSYCIAPRSGREVSYVRVDEWLGGEVPAVGSAAARDAAASCSDGSCNATGLPHPRTPPRTKRWPPWGRS